MIKKVFFSLAFFAVAAGSAAANAQVGYYQNSPNNSAIQGRIGDHVPASPISNRASHMLRQDTAQSPSDAAAAATPQPGNPGQPMQHGAPGVQGVAGVHAGGCCGNVGCDGGRGCDAGPCCGSAPAGCGVGGGCCGVGQNYFAGGCCDTGCCDSGCGRYLSFFGGWNYLHDINDPADPTTVVDFRDGYVTGFAVGRQASCNRRHEIEFAYRRNSADTIGSTAPGGPAPRDIDGDVKASSLMFNVLLEPSRTFAGFKPYVGAGIGFGYVDADIQLGNQILHSDHTGVCWQLRGGAERYLTGNVSVFAEYRFFEMPDADFEVTPPGNDFETDYEAENFVVGLNFRR